MSFHPEAGSDRDAYGFLETERNAYALAFERELGGRSATDDELNFLEANGVAPDFAGSVKRIYGPRSVPVEGYRLGDELPFIGAPAVQVRKFTDNPGVGFAPFGSVGMVPFDGGPLNAISAAQAAAAQAVAQQLAGQVVNGPPRTASGFVAAGPISIPTSMSMDIVPQFPSSGNMPSILNGGPPAGGGFWQNIGQTVLNAGTNALGQYIQGRLTGGGSAPSPQGAGGPPALPPGGGMGGQGGINLPQSGSAGNMTAGGIVMTAHGPRLRVTYPATQKTGVRTVDRKVSFGKYGWQLAARRMNVLNPHALRRSFHRISGFESFAAGALKFFGYHVTGHAKKKGRKSSRGFGRKRR